MAQNYENLLTTLTDLQHQELSIIRLSEPISAAQTTTDPSKRNSNTSADNYENISPASLTADLSHYKELFSKLRFSYLEQVTKEKFLRAIVGDPPQTVEHHENVELEAQLVGVKADLKAQKGEVAALVEGLEVKGRALSKRYQSISLQRTQLATLPDQISSLQSTISTLQSQQIAPSTNPSLSLPLPATLELLHSRQYELDQLDQQIKTLQQALPRKTREAERLENELKPLEVQLTAVVRGADEARRRKEGGSGPDELELKGRWLRGVEAGLSEMLGVGS
ncbi:hypothetical protein MMC14_008846 [Varicellaria rhodocarpa]|nr:hypothetical protein [Varicellaria rhodocarpa]